MKFIFLAFIFFISTSHAQQENIELKWLTNLEKAQKQAKKKDKPILVYFTGSDWCSPCKLLKEDFFDTSSFEELSKKFVLVEIDSPFRVDIISEKQMVYNKKVIAKYNKEKTFPKIVTLNHKGKVLGKISGYSSLRDTSNHFGFIENQISKFY